MASLTTVIGLVVGSMVIAGTSTAGKFHHVPTHSASAVAPAPKIRVVRVVGKDFSFDAPDVIPAGLTEFRFLNQGPALHHMALVRLTDGKTAEDLREALKNPGPPPSWVRFLGGPNAGAPGVESNATIDLTPGNYALVCFVDLGGPPHFVKGMLKGLRVVPSKDARVASPKPDVNIDLYDYNFKLSSPVKRGLRTIRVHNIGKQPHEVELVRLEPGKTASDVLNWAAKMEGPPPGLALGGVAGLDPGSSESFTAQFTPGRYALLCFLPDAGDGKPHFTHGMVQEITVR